MDTKFYKVIIAVVIAFVFIKEMSKRSNQDSSKSNNGNSSESQKSNSQGSKANSSSQSSSNTNVAGKDKNDSVLQSHSKKTLGDFSKLSGLHTNYENFVYDTLDLDENVVGIQGTNLVDKTRIGMMAAPLKASPDTVKEFIIENKSSFPGFPKTDLNLQNQEIPLASLNQKKLSSGTGWYGINPDNTFYGAAYVTRQDGKGSYLITISGPANYLNDNEGYFDRILDGIKLEDPQ